MTKKAFKHVSTKTPNLRAEWPVVVYFWAFGMTLAGYLIGRLFLNSMPHPYHWLSALAGGLMGIPVGWLWYRKRGDIF